MATVHRARPSMGLQHELYRRSHRVPPPGEVHPERLLDMLSMECQRRKRQSFMTEDIVTDDQLDVDAIVEDFKIDDSISACFADIGSKKSQPKSKKSKSNKQVSSTESLFNSLLINNGVLSGKSTSDNLTENKPFASNDERRFKLGIPSAMKIRFRRGKKQKNFPNVVEKSPYSPIQEIPEEESSGSATEEQIVKTQHVNIPTNEVEFGTMPVARSQSRDDSTSSDSDSTEDMIASSNDKEPSILNTQPASLSNVTDATNITNDAIKEKYIIEEFIDDLATGTKRNIPTDSIRSEDMTSWRDDVGNSVLHRCIMTGNTRAMTEVVELCPNLVTQRNESQELPIDLAVQTGQCKCLSTLLEMSEVGEDVFLSTDDLERLITLAIVGNQAQSLTILLEVYKLKSEKLTFCVDKGGNSPAHIAAKLGRLYCLYVLHTYGFDMGGCNLQGLRPVHIASDHDQQYCFRFLVQLETETKLVEQIVSRACTIDRYEMTIARCRHQLENDIQIIEPKLTEIDKVMRKDQTEIGEHVEILLREIINENTLKNRVTLLTHIEKIQKVNNFLWDSRRADVVNNLWHTFRRWVASFSELENLQHEANRQDETKVDTEEKRIIIGSIQSEVEESIMRECDSQRTRSDFGCDETSSVSNLTSFSSLLPCDTNSLRESNVTGSSGTTQDADDESTTSSKGKLCLKEFHAKNLECQSLQSSKRATFPEPMTLLFEDSSETDWSSSQSSLSSCESGRKWNKFSCKRLKVQPSKMVYGMLIPEVTSWQSSSPTPDQRRTRKLKGTSGVYQKRRASFWDLSDFQNRKSKNPRFQIENENLAPDVLMHQRIEQHLKDTMHVRTDLVETVTMASGEVFTQDLDRAFHTELTQRLSREDNSCRGKKVQYRSDLTTGMSVPDLKPTFLHKHPQSTKTKVSIRSLIAKLAKKSKKSRPTVSKSGHRTDNTRSYTQSEFAERYRPCLGSSV